jgi:hypothetical protein
VATALNTAPHASMRGEEPCQLAIPARGMRGPHRGGARVPQAREKGWGLEDFRRVCIEITRGHVVYVCVTCVCVCEVEQQSWTWNALSALLWSTGGSAWLPVTSDT